MEEKVSNKVEKEFGLTTLSIKNRTTVFVLTALIVIMGVSSYISLPKESFPEISQPIVYVGTAHPGNSPVDMENLITRPIEKELNSIDDVENIKSTSVQDYSTIIIEFTSDTNIEDALTKVKDAVDKADLPTDLVNDPDIFEMNISEVPVMNINLSGDYSIEELNDKAEYLEDEIEKLSEVSRVEIRGVGEKEVRINVDPYQMEAREVNFRDIENAVRDENITLSGGNVKEGSIRRSLRIVGEFESPEELLDVVIKQEKGNIVYLRDVAEVEFDYKESTSYARLAKKPVVMVDVIKRSGENLLIANDKIHDIIDKARENGKLPAGVQVNITGDQSQQTRDMVESLENNIISGVILVVIVLLFFLGTRNALFVGAAIPLSMFMSFMILGAFGITINMMVLFSLIMALGMLVDNGIVVVENVYRLREEGYSAFEATRLGVGEVAMPIIASTSTTLAAFLPLAFWPGIMGEFMKFLPITLIVTLGSSLFVALVINPVLVTVFMKLDLGEPTKHKKIWIYAGVAIVFGALMLLIKATVFGNLSIVLGLLIIIDVYALVPVSRVFQNSFLPWLEKLYMSLLTFAFKGRNPAWFFFGTVALLVFSIMLMGVFPPKVNFFPETPPKYVNVFIEYPVGTDIETTNKFSNGIEDLVLNVVEQYGDVIESVIGNVGEGTADPLDQSAFGQKDTPNKARIMVNFVEFKHRGGLNTKDILDTLKASMKGYPGVSVVVDKDVNGPPVGKPISIEVSGEEFDVLIDVTEQMKKLINESGIKGVEKLKADMETGKPELVIDIDREKARRFGLSTSSIAMEVRTALFGKEISKYKEGEDDYEIQLRLQEKYRNDVDALMNKRVVFRNQTSGNMH
ncbi:MAG: efflux RND transporter permease subunit, partial [Cyclobacteriaceae bacterium]|nr:efflux RND transporter permease subunit [Cyclobacteriaceae bacterium]